MVAVAAANIAAPVVVVRTLSEAMAVMPSRLLAAAGLIMQVAAGAGGRLAGGMDLTRPGPVTLALAAADTKILPATAGWVAMLAMAAAAAAGQVTRPATAAMAGRPSKVVAAAALAQMAGPLVLAAHLRLGAMAGQERLGLAWLRLEQRQAAAAADRSMGIAALAETECVA